MEERMKNNAKHLYADILLDGQTNKRVTETICRKMNTTYSDGSKGEKYTHYVVSLDDGYAIIRVQRQEK